MSFVNDVICLFTKYYNIDFYCFLSCVNINLHLNHVSFQLKEDELNDAVILVFANKQDMPNAMTAAELTNALNLNNLRNRRVSININYEIFCKTYLYQKPVFSLNLQGIN